MTTKKAEISRQVVTALKACEGKKALHVALLDTSTAPSAFTDFFLICSGSNPRQIQAIADDVEMQLKQLGLRPNNIEGYNQAEWVLIDYVDFVVHIFSERARQYYDLERLWKSATRLSREELMSLAGGKRKKAEGEPLRAARKPAARKRTVAHKHTTTRRKTK
jgi:ribosome-associated protein